MSDPLRSFPTAASLSAFHAGRTGLYRALFELLRMPPSKGSWESAQRALDASSAQHAEQDALDVLLDSLAGSSVRAAAAEFGELFVGPRAISMRCEQPRCGVRAAAFSASDTLLAEDRASEIQVLATLAERTADALRAGLLAQASALSDLQGRFLMHHAATCQRKLSKALRQSDAPFFSGVGTALGDLVADDLRLLG